jgi:hypothetical protein
MNHELMIGNLWTMDYLSECEKLNKDIPKARIAEMYGSVKGLDPIGSARPDSRLPAVEKENFETYVKRANKSNIEINYTMNISCVGNLGILSEKENEIAEFLHYIEECGVKRVTVAHPLIAKLVAKHSKKLTLEASTIMHIDTIGQLQKLKDMCENTDKVCMNLYRNRDFKFLKQFKKEADKLGITTELMANEFCSIGGIPCYGLYRNSCYMVHSHEGNDDLHFDGYPIKGPTGCITSRIQSPASYLKARFILPQWYDKYYEETGISHFKVTGRTHAQKDVLPIVESYVKGNFEGNLMDLWLLDKDHAGLNIDTSLLKDFIDHWIENADFPCDKMCGVNCNICDDEFERVCPDVPLHRPEFIHKVEERIGIE